MRDVFQGKRDSNPKIAEPAPRAEFVEQLTAQPQRIDYRPEKVQKQDTRFPRFNRLYDSLRTDQAWRYCADAVVTGTSLVVAAGSTSQEIKLANAPHWRLSQWPSGVQLYLVINGWQYAQEATVATPGGLITRFEAKQGATALLSVAQSNTPGVSIEPLIVIPQMISDPDELTLGKLLFALSPGGASTITLDWGIQFAVAYLAPQMLPDTGDLIYLEGKHRVYHLE